MTVDANDPPAGHAIEVMVAAFGPGIRNYTAREEVRVTVLGLLESAGLPVTDKISRGGIGSSAAGVDPSALADGVGFLTSVYGFLRNFLRAYTRNERRERLPEFVIMIEAGRLPDIVRPIVAVLPDVDAKLKEFFPSLRSQYSITGARCTSRAASVYFPTDLVDDSTALRTLHELDRVSAEATVQLTWVPREWWWPRPLVEVKVVGDRRFDR
ncbi:hypothetical protein [Arthrobacter tecti]